MRKGKWLFCLMVFIAFMGSIGIAGQNGIAKTAISLTSLSPGVFDFTYIEFPFSLKLPFSLKKMDIFTGFFIGPYLVLNSPGNLALGPDSLRTLIFDRGIVLGIGIDIYFSTPKLRRPRKPSVKIRVL